MPQLLRLLLSTVPLMKTGPKRSLRAEMGRGRLCLNSPAKAAAAAAAAASTAGGADPKTQDEAESVTELQFRKAIFLASAFCLSNVRCFLRG